MKSYDRVLPNSSVAAISFNVVGELKAAARKRGEDTVDFSMGNPGGPTPTHIVQKLIETVPRSDTHRYSASKVIRRLRQAICA
jgi:alanine-synthesizing transaminase